jgi:hypothetical protein
MRVFAGLLALVFTISAGAASASSINGVHITEIVPNNAGIVRIYIDQSRTGLPSCASGTATALSINVTTTAGQALVSALYLACVIGLFLASCFIVVLLKLRIVC